MRNGLDGTNTAKITLGDLVAAVYDDFSDPAVPEGNTAEMVTHVIVDFLRTSCVTNRLHLKTLQQRL
jgi:hypothetical protein